jgi:hypothetical protein
MFAGEVEDRRRALAERTHHLEALEFCNTGAGANGARKGAYKKSALSASARRSTVRIVRSNETIPQTRTTAKYRPSLATPHAANITTFPKPIALLATVPRS